MEKSVKVHPRLVEAVLKDLDPRFVLDSQASALLTSVLEELINTQLVEEDEPENGSEEAPHSPQEPATLFNDVSSGSISRQRSDSHGPSSE